ncbi:L,D-transpeptidase [Microbacterium sp.]|uniref:L,D-transpeptidase n=1 Tax=Microbacterium sp. TaxID=51671 RepID=UPI003A924204
MSDQEHPTRKPGARAGALIGLGSVVVIAVVIAIVAVVVWSRTDATPAARSASTAELSSPTPTPSPAPTGFPANHAVYDATALPQANVFAVLPQLPVDAEPHASFAGYTARPLADLAPIWADPLGDPVAALPREYRYGGTTVAVIEKQNDWVHVLLTGRQGIPSAGNPAQLTGWLRTTDIELAPIDVTVEVSISARTIDIVRAGVPERIASDFAWGTDQTPTPLGRSFIHLTEVTSFEYARGLPTVYLSLQSPTLDGFGGQDVAVTAFHYHDERTGAISNGCIRLDEAAITGLAELPAGTGVSIRP